MWGWQRLPDLQRNAGASLLTDEENEALKRLAPHSLAGESQA